MVAALDWQWQAGNGYYNRKQELVLHMLCKYNTDFVSLLMYPTGGMDMAIFSVPGPLPRCAHDDARGSDNQTHAFGD